MPTSYLYVEIEHDQDKASAQAAGAGALRGGGAAAAGGDSDDDSDDAAATAASVLDGPTQVRSRVIVSFRGRSSCRWPSLTGMPFTPAMCRVVWFAPAPPPNVTPLRSAVSAFLRWLRCTT